MLLFISFIDQLGIVSKDRCASTTEALFVSPSLTAAKLFTFIINFSGMSRPLAFILKGHTYIHFRRPNSFSGARAYQKWMTDHS